MKLSRPAFPQFLPLCLVLLLAPSGAAQAAEAPVPRIAFLDATRVIENYVHVQECQARVAQRLQSAQEQYEAKNKELEAIKPRYLEREEASRNPASTNEVRQAAAKEAEGLMQEFEARRKELDEFEESAQRMLARERDSIRSQCLDEIAAVVREIALKRGLSAVIESSGKSREGLPAALFVAPDCDLTAEVIELLNKYHPVETAPAR